MRALYIHLDEEDYKTLKAFVKRSTKLHYNKRSKKYVEYDLNLRDAVQYLIRSLANKKGITVKTETGARQKLIKKV